MDWLARATEALLRLAEPMLPTEHRAWARALRTEADQVPAGRSRLAWLVGGVRFTLRAAVLNRRLGYPLVFAAAVAGIAWSAWSSGPPGDSAVAINRTDVITVSAILAGLPWAVRRTCGSAAGGRPARMIRIAGYAAILVLVLVKAAVERVADAPPNNLHGSALAWTGEVAFLAVMACYAVVILACTARRAPVISAEATTAAAIGVALGILVYALGPLGCPLRLTGWWPARLYDAALALGAFLALGGPVAAGLAATRRAGCSLTAGARARLGALAGLCTGVAAALVVAVLSTATIALLPYDAGLRSWAAGHAGQWTPIIGQVTPVVGIRLGYVAGASAFAAGYLIVLLLSPLFGCGLGASASRATDKSGRASPQPPGSGSPAPGTQ